MVDPFKSTLLCLLKLYRTYLSRQNICRFSPSCSQYCYQAIQKYGTLKGMAKCFLRLLRCHPYQKGGLDPLK